MVTVSGDVSHSYNFCLICFPICFVFIKLYDNYNRFILYYVVFNVLGINGNWALYAMNTIVFNNRFSELRTINACLLIIRKECGNYRFKIKYAVVILILVKIFLWQLSRLCLLLYLLPKQLLENKNSCVVCNKAVNILVFFSC